VGHRRTNKIVDNCRLITVVASNKAQNRHQKCSGRRVCHIAHTPRAPLARAAPAKNAAWTLSTAHTAQ